MSSQICMCPSASLEELLAESIAYSANEQSVMQLSVNPR